MGVVGFGGRAASFPEAEPGALPRGSLEPRQLGQSEHAQGSHQSVRRFHIGNGGRHRSFLAGLGAIADSREIICHLGPGSAAEKRAENAYCEPAGGAQLPKPEPLSVQFGCFGVFSAQIAQKPHRESKSAPRRRPFHVPPRTGGASAAIVPAATGTTGACGAKPEYGPTGSPDWRAASTARTGAQ